MERKQVLGVLAVLLVVGVVFVWPKGKWFVYGMAVNETMAKFPRFATPQDVLGLDEKLVELGQQRYGYDPSTLQVATRVEGVKQSVGGLVWWYLHVTITHSGREYRDVSRIEGTLTPDWFAAVEEGGVPVQRPD